MLISHIDDNSIFNQAIPPLPEGRFFLTEVNGSPLDQFGMGIGQFAPSKVPFTDLFFMREDLEAPCPVKICIHGVEQEHDIPMIWNPALHEEGVRYV